MSDRTLGRRHFFSQSHSTGAQAHERGKRAESRFLEAWRDCRLYPDWLISVRAATIFEDRQEKTDAVMLLDTKLEIRIQIKCNQYDSYRWRKSFYRLGVVLVQIQEIDSHEAIRQRTIQMIFEYQAYLQRVAEHASKSEIHRHTHRPARNNNQKTWKRNPKSMHR